MTPSSVLLMIASSEESTMDASNATRVASFIDGSCERGGGGSVVMLIRLFDRRQLRHSRERL
jgi:hypothetical protein